MEIAVSGVPHGTADRRSTPSYRTTGLLVRHKRVAPAAPSEWQAEMEAALAERCRNGGVGREFEDVLKHHRNLLWLSLMRYCVVGLATHARWLERCDSRLLEWLCVVLPHVHQQVRREIERRRAATIALDS